VCVSVCVCVCVCVSVCVCLSVCVDMDERLNNCLSLSHVCVVDEESV